MPSSTRRSLLHALACSHANQPATALWRAYELEAVCKHASLSGVVVDLGCGDGGLGAVVFSRMPGIRRVVGIEPDETDAALARRAGWYGDVVVARGEATGLPDAVADTVFANSVLEHIPDVVPVLKEAARILRPGGRLVTTVPSHQFLECLMGAPVGRAVSRIKRQTYTRYLDQRLAHHHYHSPGEWTQLMAAAGLELGDALPYFPRPAVRAWEWLSDLSGGLLHAAMGAEKHPRQVQAQLGLLGHGAALVRPLLVPACMAVCLPWLDYELADGAPAGGLLLRAVRPG